MRYGIGKTECPEGHNHTCHMKGEDNCRTEDCLFYTKYYIWTPWVLIPAAFAYLMVR